MSQAGPLTMDELLALTPVVPVLTIDRVEDALPLAESLLAAGVGLLEITLRTSAALPAIERIASALPQVVLAAGTVTRADQLHSVQSAGGRLAISPGLTAELLLAARELAMPLLPGVATPSELMSGLAAGLHHFKLFPASVVGGVGWLQAMAGPFAKAAFCPTGGIDRDEVAGYLAQPNVRCVGASWLASRAQIQAGDWAGITAGARQCLAGLPAAR